MSEDDEDKLPRALKRGRQVAKEEEEKQDAMRNRLVVLDRSRILKEVCGAELVKLVKQLLLIAEQQLVHQHHIQRSTRN